MYNKIDLIIKTIGVVAAIITAIAAYAKCSYEKNREFYLKRLNDVYAPLYGLLVKQETYRYVFSDGLPSVQENAIMGFYA